MTWYESTKGGSAKFFVEYEESQNHLQNQKTETNTSMTMYVKESLEGLL